VVREDASRIGVTKKSDVDDLLDKFVVSTLATPETMRETRATLKRLAGLDATAMPPPVIIAAIEEPPPVVATPEPIDDTFVLVRRNRASSMRLVHVALVTLGLVLAGLLGHYVPRWIAEAHSDVVRQNVVSQDVVTQRP
jgi:hypothetical protein